MTTVGYERAARIGLAVVALLLPCAEVIEARADEPGTPAAGLLRITGSSTMCPMVAAIGERFRTVRPDVRVDVQCGGSERGIKDVREGSAEIGMIARALKADEKDLLGFPMARDGVSVIVHKSNPMGLSPTSRSPGSSPGRSTPGKPLNGKNAPITVILREKEKPASELFEKHFKSPGGSGGRSSPATTPSPSPPSRPIPMRSATSRRERRSAQAKSAPRYASSPWAACCRPGGTSSPGTTRSPGPSP